MEKWQNFFVWKMGRDSRGNDIYPPLESVATWGIYCKSIPFKLFDKIKQPAKRSWPDEHGDDEYIPQEGLYLEAYNMNVELACKKTSTVQDVREKVGQFLKYLRETGHINLYSSYTRIGRQNVRLESVSDNAKWRSYDDLEFLIFEVTFHVGDPITDTFI